MCRQRRRLLSLFSRQNNLFSSRRGKSGKLRGSISRVSRLYDFSSFGLIEELLNKTNVPDMKRMHPMIGNNKSASTRESILGSCLIT